MSDFSITQATGLAHVDVVVSDGDVQVDLNSLTCLDTLRNIYNGRYQGHPARFVEYRHLPCHARQGIEVYSMLVNEVTLRLKHQTQSHVLAAGIYRTSHTLGSKVYLVEIKCRHIALKDYLAENRNIDRGLLLKQVIDIIEDLHSKGLVLGAIRLKSFVVDPSGKILLSGFEDMRVEDANMPFRPLLGPSLGAMCYLAPELLQSLGSGGHAPLTRATDVYSVGCFAYELFTDRCPLASIYRGHSKFMTQAQVIADVVDSGKRPERPIAASDAFARFGLTGEIWSVLEDCWCANPEGRPSASDLLARITPI